MSAAFRAPLSIARTASSSFGRNGHTATWCPVCSHAASCDLRRNQRHDAGWQPEQGAWPDSRRLECRQWRRVTVRGADLGTSCGPAC